MCKQKSSEKYQATPWLPSKRKQILLLEIKTFGKCSTGETKNKR